MKVHTNQTNSDDTLKATTNTCCSTSESASNASMEPCCEQPTDGSTCCDKTLTKEENSKTSSCC